MVSLATQREFTAYGPSHSVVLAIFAVGAVLLVWIGRRQTEAQARVLRVTAPEIIRTSGWEETLVCCVSGSVQIENASGEAATLSGADVARCNPGDAAITCGPYGPDPALLLVASVRHRGA